MRKQSQLNDTRESSLSVIQHSSRAEIMARFIKRFILDGHWAHGVALAEADLQRALAFHYREEILDALSHADASKPPKRRKGETATELISRTPLREGLLTLENQMLITRGHRGSAQLNVFDRRDRNEIAMLRRHIEPRMAKQAAQSPPAAPQMVKLKQIWTEMESLIADAKNAGRYVEAEIRFHTQIAAISSRVFAHIVEQAAEQTVFGGRRIFELVEHLDEKIHTEHKNIYNAIVECSPLDASRSMGEHLRNARKRSDEVVKRFQL